MYFLRFITFFVLFLCTCDFLQAQVTVAGANAATPNGVYATLNSAFSAINATSQAGLNIIVTITANTTEPASAILNQNPGPWNSLLIQPSGIVTVSGNLATPLVDFNGADNVTISGANTLTFNNSNTSQTASTIRFVNDASFNTVTGCIIRGATTGIPTTAGHGALIFIAGTGLATGNDNITISDNDIGGSSAIPFVAIKGYGSVSSVNNNISVTNNLIHDFFSTVQSHCRGVFVGTGNSVWSITGNRIYQTADRQWLSGGAPNVYSCIEVLNSNSGNGHNFTISSNVLGFRDELGTGYTVMKNGGTAATNIASNIHALIFNSLGSTGNIVSDNIIGGFDLKSSRATGTAGENIFIGIFVRNGSADVLNNIVGSATSNNSILIRSTATTTASPPVPAAGIYARGTGVVNISGNTVSGITMSFMAPGTNGSDRIGLHCIFSDNTNTTYIRDNIVGSSLSGSINFPFANARVLGIFCSGGVSGGKSIITGNTVQNIIHSGVRISFSGNGANIIGILVSPAAPGDSISRNTVIHLLSNAITASGAKTVAGIYADASAGLPALSIVKNIINNLGTPGGPGTVSAITSGTGRTIIVNNMIALGAGSASQESLYGIDQAFGVNASCYFNSIHIYGTVSGSFPSSAIRVSSTSAFSGTIVMRNNIFCNTRTGTAYGLQVSSFNTYTGDHNVIFGSPFGIYQGTAQATHIAWFASTGQEGPGVSKYSTVTFTSPDDLHSSDPVIRNSAVAIPGVTDDIDDFSRNQCKDIGCDETDPTLIPGVIYSWVGGQNNSWCEECNWDREVVPPPLSDVVVRDNCFFYPMLQAGCGNQLVNDFTMLANTSSSLSAVIDLGTFTLSVTGNVDISGTCFCSGVTSFSPAASGMLAIVSATSSQVVDIRNSSSTYPGQLCKLQIDKTAPGVAPSANHEAYLKGNLVIEYLLEINNGVLLSQTGSTFDANEFTAANFKTITILNDEPAAVIRPSIPSRNKNNGFFMGRLNRAIKTGTGINEYLFPLGYRSSSGTGIFSDYYYAPVVSEFSLVTSPGFVTATFLNNNSNGTVDGSNIGFTGHGCFNPLEIDDQGGNTAVSCAGKEIDMIAFNYWDMVETTGILAGGDPAVAPGTLGDVNFSIQCAGDVFTLTALDGLTGSQLRLMNRSNVALPGNAGQGPWSSTAGNHSPAAISVNPGISMYSMPLLEAAARLNVGQFGGFGAAGNGDSPLPVELLFFTASRNSDGSVFCNWATASEINSDYFIVESATGRDDKGMLMFSQVGKVKAAGNSNTTLHYSLMDATGYEDVVYFRLTQFDYDGKYTYSNVVALRFDESFSGNGIYPNPVTPDSKLYFNSEVKSSAQLELMDVSGRRIFSKTIQISQGFNEVKIFDGQLPAPGFYLLRDPSTGVTRIVVP